ncbi:MAG: ABC transporter permease, partial [Oscillospiraceae bacterium]|nr:ABC transporter permease [Oscillospiraceae bacterium]
MIKTIKEQFLKIKKHQFLFEELVKRDFKKKYKRTALGMLWSLVSPLMQLLVMSVVFTHFFGQNKPH